MTTPGGSGFETGPDYVAARLSIDVPSEGISSLRELSDQIDRFRTSTEQAARGSESFVKYLQQMVQAGNAATEMSRNLAQQLERTIDMQVRQMNSSGGGGSAANLPLSRAVPQAYTDNFAGMGAGTGSRPQSASDIDSQVINPALQRDPASVMNSAAGRSAVRLGGLPSASPQDILSQQDQRTQARDQAVRSQQASDPGGSGGGGSWSGLAQHMMNESGPGGTNVGTLGMLQHGANAVGGWLQNRVGGGGASGAGAGGLGHGGAGVPGGMGGTLASLSPALLKGAGLLGMAATGLAAVQQGGQMYQGYKNMGLIRGQGAGEGLKDEAQIRMLALNPFISTEQARQVITAGLTEGYSGKSYDTVTDFMANNLKNMNMQVSDSVMLLRKNVNEGGQSVAGLAASLGMMKELSKNGAMSLPDWQKGFQETSAALVGAGMSGGMASQDAVMAGSMWNGDQALKGQGFQMVQDMASSDSGLAQLRAFGGASLPSGLMPGAMGVYMQSNGGSLTQMTDNYFKTMAIQVSKAPGAKEKGSVQYANAVYMFQLRIRAMDPNNKAASDITIAQKMYDSYVFEGGPMAQAQADIKGVAGQVNPISELFGGQEAKMATGNAMARTAIDAGKSFLGMITGNETAQHNAYTDLSNSWGNAVYAGGAKASNPILDQIISSNGAGNVEVNMDGKWSRLTGSKDQVSALAGGGATWRRKGDTGDGLTLSQTPQGGGGAGNTNVSFSPAEVRITIDNKGNAAVSQNPVKLTPTQEGAMSGVNGYQTNNPRPGDGQGYGGSQGLH